MSEDQIKQFIDQATQSLQGGNFQEAVDLADQAIALDERNSEAHVLRGIALSQLSRADEATQSFRNAIMHSPYNSKAYYNLGVHYFTQGQTHLAEEMVREAIRIDPKHVGARELLSKIESQRTPQSGVGVTPQAPFPGDPLAAPPPAGTGMAPPPGTGVAPTEGPATPPPGSYGAQSHQPYGGPPNSGPYSGAAPQPTGYYRPGYESSGVHSLDFVANMGKTWDIIGIVLAIGMLVLMLINIGTSWSMINQLMQDAAAGRSTSNPNIWAGQGANMVISFIYYPFLLMSLIWMILDLVDRRGNWLWIIPYILCCCCSLQSVPKLIYIFAGRNK